MGTPQPLEAFGSGDFATAIPLLEGAARDADYSSEILNHAWTLALHRAGESARLADAAFLIGSRLAPVDPAAAMDYFQRALAAELDPVRIRRIGEIHEEWALAVSGKPSGAIERVAHVVGSLDPGHRPADYVRMLSTSLAFHGIESQIFTTEWASSWFFNAVEARDQAARNPTDAVIASVEGDFLQRAEKVAHAIRESGAQVALFHAGLSEQITARVAGMHPAPIQINVSHRHPMDANLFEGYIHVQRNEGPIFRSRPAEWIPPASMIESRIGGDSLSRESLGLENAGTVSASFGETREVAVPFLKALIHVLKSFPRHFHVFAGTGGVRAIRAALHAEGVLSRVRFLGQADPSTLIGTLDVYLAPFPNADIRYVLDAMGAGKPVVVLGEAKSALAELVGISELVAVEAAEYPARAGRLIMDPALRSRMSGAVRDRFRQEYDPQVIGRRCLRFFERVAQSV